ncbi:MAG TPA: PKD domain-containing protein [Bacteroidia bacterium]
MKFKAFHWVIILFFFAKTAAACPGTVSFTFPSTWCINTPVTFTNTSTNSPTSYTWTFGDASAPVTVTTNADQTHTYTTTGPKIIKLVRTFSNGCKDSVSHTVTIVANTVPAPTFTYSPNNGCANIPVQFTNTSGGGLTFNWDFGDAGSNNNTSTQINPTHNFSATGTSGSTTYTVSLTATNNNGCSNTSTQNISVGNKPDATLLDSNIFQPFSNCGNPNLTPATPGYHIAVQNGSSTQATNATYTINWGDGSTNFTGTTFTQVSHDYTALGIYDIVLTVTGANGCVATKTYQVFNLTNPSVGLNSPGNTLGCSPLTLTFPVTLDSANLNFTTYTFDFDDGSPKITWNPPAVFTSITHTFSTASCGRSGNQFTVKVTAKNACDSTTATVNNIKISSKPTAQFAAIPNPGCVNIPVTFTNGTIPGCNATNGSTVTSYVWNFGDGTPATATSTSNAPVAHTYTATGTYTATLTAASSCGPSTFSLPVKILGPPTAKFTITPPACAPVTINTTNQSTGDSLVYFWNASPGGWSFTGGTDADDQHPKFLFSAAGTYTISLTTTNPCGVQQKDTIITIKSVPTVSLSSIPGGCRPYAVTPSATYTAGGGTISTYAWTFTGGTPTTANTAAPPAVTYTAAGNYTVNITATNECGPANSSQTFSVTAAPAANAGSNTSVCGGSPAQIGSASVPGLQYSWSSLPAGFSSFVSDPTVNPTVSTLYIVSVSNGLCSVNDTVSVDVNPLPTVDPGSPHTVCITSGTFTQAGTPTGGTWSGTGVTAGGVFTPSTAGVGTHTLTYSYTDATTTCSASANVSITVSALPTVSAGPDISECNQPGSVTYSASPAGGTWSGTGITGAGVFTPSTAGIGPHQLIYTYSDANGCSSKDTIIVTVQNPSIVNAGANDTLCLNAGVLTLTGFTPAGGTWSGTAVSGNTFDPSVAGAGTTTLTYNFGSGTCASSGTRDVVVQALPAIVPGSNVTVCVDAADFNMSGFSPAGGTWSGTGITNAALGTFDASAAGLGAHTLNYSYTDPSTGCNNTATKTITVTGLPVVDAGTGSLYCNQPSTITLSGFTPAGGVWSGNGITNASGIFDPSTAPLGNDTLTYTYTDAGGCINTDTIINSIIAPQVANAGTNDSVCIDVSTLTLIGFSPAGGAWSGTGVDVSGLFTPATSGVGSFTLTYTYGVGTCQTSATKVVVVKPLPVVDAGTNETTCISSPAFSLSGFSPAGGTWSGTGVSAAGLFTPATAGVGVHTLTYSYTDPVTHCSDSKTKTIEVGALPVMGFTVPAISCINIATVFTNTTTGAASDAWTFGDGGTSTVTSPSHTYTTTGTYTIQLVSTSSLGCVDSVSQTIQLTAPPVATFATSPDSGCAPLNVSFTNSSSGDFISFTWDLGNGVTVTDTTPVAQTYQQGIYDTTYYISLTVSNQCASVGYFDSVVVKPIPVVDFGPNLSEGCSPFTPLFNNTSTGNADVYTWNFGDGTAISNLINPTHTFFTGMADTTFIIELVGVNECGSDTMRRPILVHPNTVTAFFNSSTTSGCAPHTVNFTNFATGGTFITWNFGDGNTSTQTNPQHTYLTAGTYTCYQYVNNGCSYDTTSVSITVHPQPTLSFIPNPSSICARQPITFNNTSTNAVNYDWYFGDGDSSNLVNPSHSFDTAGVYTITLIGTSTTFGCRDTITSNVTINSLPIPQFVSNVLFGCMPLPINFSNNSTNSTFYTWDFGDGNSSTSQNPTHTYNNQGTYTITLVAENLNNCKDSVTGQVNVYPKPVAAFAMSSTYSCNFPVNVTFTNNSSGADAYQWDLGNGQTTTSTHTVGNYTANASYPVSLIANNTYGCYDTVTDVFNVYPTPVVHFTPSGILGCEPYAVTFSNETQDANTYSWIFTDGSTVATDSTPVHVFEHFGTYGVTLIATSYATCSDTLSMTNLITVNPSPTSDFNYNQLYSEGVPNGTIQFLNASEGAVSYVWNFGDGAGTNTGIHPEHQYPGVDTYYVTLISTNQYSCSDTIIKPVEVDYFQGLFVPNAFIPNSAYEDLRYFIPKGKTLKSYKLQIFNTWGTLIFESDKLDGTGAPSEGWDGTFQGEPCAQDVYVWKVEAIFRNDAIWLGKEYPNNEVKNTGTVSLIR